MLYLRWAQYGHSTGTIVMTIISKYYRIIRTYVGLFHIW